MHICTGSILVKDAEPGDVIEVRIDDIFARPSRNPGYEGRHFGSKVAAWWGYHYGELIAEPKPRENVTIYEIFPGDGEEYVKALYAYDGFRRSIRSASFTGLTTIPACRSTRTASLGAAP